MTTFRTHHEAPRRAESIQLNTLKILNKIEAGRIFTVTFIKRNKKLRVLTGKKGVQHNLTGEGMGYIPTDHNVVNCFDLYKWEYRNFRWDSVMSIHIDGVFYR